MSEEIAGFNQRRQTASQARQGGLQPSLDLGKMIDALLMLAHKRALSDNDHGPKKRKT